MFSLPCPPTRMDEVDTHARHLRRLGMFGAILCGLAAVAQAGIYVVCHQDDTVRQTLIVLYAHATFAAVILIAADQLFGTDRMLRRVCAKTVLRHGPALIDGMPVADGTPDAYVVLDVTDADGRTGSGVARLEVVDGRYGLYESRVRMIPRWQVKPRYFRGEQPAARHREKMASRAAQLNVQSGPPADTVTS